jgi:hypothetical protein
LLPLPLEPFRYYQYGERVVHLDGCVEVEAAYYGLPPGWIGRSVKVQWDALHVRILHPSTKPTSSRAPASETRRISHPEEDHPKKNAAEHSATLAARRTRGNPDRQVLPVDLSAASRDQHPPHPGMHSLIKKYGAAAVEDACATALDIGVRNIASCAVIWSAARTRKCF